MKKILAILPLIIMSCQKKEVVSENTVDNDSVIVSEQKAIHNKMDSAANGIVSIDENNALKESFKTERTVGGNKIIQTINADQLPILLSDEFTTENQQMVVKIRDFNRRQLIGKISPENSDMNIRFNQIKLANGHYDGPFGREIKYDIKEKGEIWLIIGKSNMASGEAKGKFTVNLE
ncbi:hypothetical protein [Chryseobacterium salivictor]|uniref:Uncharacterized protein n=1 Tax=Chryseobacterium salivictor TaxID=2547600 RepID=A0A4P6ZDC6_9FLAO|nr:hypothetical protein [Chryseobacterium salivictor]QBO57435.1 hypothetical protein NBC122_00598 [Chryseobacterium salivictor]